jgi:NAD(P)-dependent dehydrogenase (short-subunit alcohol dehydrogenase family)
MSSVKGKVAVVTGAGSGIGRALAIELARRGARLAISDLQKSTLKETERLIGAVEHSAVLDVSDRAAVARYAAAVVKKLGVVHQLYNNAGIGGGGLLLDTEYATLEKVISVNLWGVIHGTKEFLPHLIASGDGHLINVSSLNGLMAQAGLSTYCTSKFAVRGFTEAVRAELEAFKHPVRVSVVHPGGVKTNIADAALAAIPSDHPMRGQAERVNRIYNDKLLRLSPEAAARTILDGVEADRARILVGPEAFVLDALVRLLPARYTRVVNFVAGLFFSDELAAVAAEAPVRSAG